MIFYAKVSVATLDAVKACIPAKDHNGFLIISIDDLLDM